MRSRTSVVGSDYRRSASAIVATVAPSGSCPKSPPTATVIMASGILTPVFLLGPPTIASAAGVSIFGGRAPPVVPRTQNQP
ncbi:endopeptidase La [Sesbania bispinosa]|nr:endopeptidase La [Sesbania bispinosa]